MAHTRVHVPPAEQIHSLTAVPWFPYLPSLFHSHLPFRLSYSYQKQHEFGELVEIIVTIYFGAGICKASIGLPSETPAAAQSLGLTSTSTCHLGTPSHPCLMSSQAVPITDTWQGPPDITPCFTGLVQVIKEKQAFISLSGSRWGPSVTGTRMEAAGECLMMHCCAVNIKLLHALIST